MHLHCIIIMNAFYYALFVMYRERKHLSGVFLKSVPPLLPPSAHANLLLISVVASSIGGNPAAVGSAMDPNSSSFSRRPRRRHRRGAPSSSLSSLSSSSSYRTGQCPPSSLAQISSVNSTRGMPSMSATSARADAPVAAPGGDRRRRWRRPPRPRGRPDPPPPRRRQAAPPPRKHRRRRRRRRRRLRPRSLPQSCR